MVKLDKKNVLIVENSNSSLKRINESKDSSNMLLEGVFTQFGVRNRNDRIYTASKFLPHMEELLERKKELGVIYGELDHPDSFELSLQRASHIIESLSYDETSNCVNGSIKLLPTHHGRQAFSIVESGVPIFVSSRAAGITESNGEVTIKRLFTYDVVGDPGFANTAMNRVMNESLGYSNNSNFRIYNMEDDTAINEYVTDRGGDGRAEQTTAAHFGEYKLYLEGQILNLTSQLEESVRLSNVSGKRINEMAEELEKLKEHNSELTKYTKYLEGRTTQLRDLTESVEKRTGVIEEHNNVLAEHIEASANYSQLVGENMNKNNQIISNTVDSEIKQLAENMNKFNEATMQNFNNVAQKVEVLKEFSNHLSSVLHKNNSYTDSIGEKLESVILFTESVRQLTNKAVDYSEAIGEKVESNISFSEMLGEKLEQAIQYSDELSRHIEGNIRFTEYTAAEVDATQQYTEILGEHLDRSITYADFLGETLDKSVVFGEHLAENLRDNIAYSTYLGESLGVVEGALLESVETQAAASDHVNYIIESINSNKGLLKESSGKNIDLKTFEDFNMDTASRDQLVALKSKLQDINNNVDQILQDIQSEPTADMSTMPVEPVVDMDEQMPVDPDMDASTIADEIDGMADADTSGDVMDDFPDADAEGDTTVASDGEVSNNFGDDEYVSTEDGKGEEDDDDDDEDPFGDDVDDADEGKMTTENYDTATEGDTTEGDTTEGDTTLEADDTDKEFDDEFEGEEVNIEEGEETFAMESYVKVLKDSKIGIVEKVLENNRYQVKVDGVINEYAAHELEQKNRKSTNIKSDIQNMIESIKKREASKNTDDPHFFEFLSEQSKAAFTKLSPAIKEEIVAVAENRTYYSEGDVLAIIREVTTETNETFEQRLLRNMPKEIRPIWERLNYAKQQEKLSEAQFYTLDTDHAMHEFWMHRRFDEQNEGRKLITESLNDDVTSPSDESIDAFLTRFNGR